MPRTVDCPGCGAVVAWTPANPYRPFCSQRCRINDLGAWAAEQYRVSGPSSDSAPEVSPAGSSPDGET